MKPSKEAIELYEKLQQSFGKREDLAIIQSTIEEAWNEGYVEGQLSIHKPAAQPQRGEINDCRICGEDALIVPCSGQFFIRVRRTSKCKKVSPCKTGLCSNPSEAVKTWNKQILI